MRCASVVPFALGPGANTTCQAGGGTLPQWLRPRQGRTRGMVPKHVARKDTDPNRAWGTGDRVSSAPFLDCGWEFPQAPVTALVTAPGVDGSGGDRPIRRISNLLITLAP